MYLDENLTIVLVSALAQLPASYDGHHLSEGRQNYKNKTLEVILSVSCVLLVNFLANAEPMSFSWKSSDYPKHAGVGLDHICGLLTFY